VLDDLAVAVEHHDILERRGNSRGGLAICRLLQGRFDEAVELFQQTNGRPGWKRA